jgi:hypothetical protein
LIGAYGFEAVGRRFGSPPVLGSLITSELVRAILLVTDVHGDVHVLANGSARRPEPATVLSSHRA